MIKSNSASPPYIRYALIVMIGLILIKGITSGSLILAYQAMKQGYRSSLPVTVTHIAGQEFHIPSEYMDWGLRDKEYGFHIVITYPAMTGFRADHHIDQNTASNQLLVLATDIATTTSFQFRLAAEKQQLGGYHYIGDEYGLRHYKANKVLLHDELPSSKDETKLKDIFTDSDDDTLTTIIVYCDGDTAVSYPGCSMQFVDHSLLYDIGFRKTKMSEWKSIKEGILNLIQTFRTAQKN